MTPVTASDDDPNAVELGVKFQADVDGQITGLRFYKGAGNTGTHVANLWTVDGTNLATATFANETASGWQQVDLAAPVAIAADTTYVASYFAPNGGYAFDGDYFSSAFSNGPLTALASGSSGGNGVYEYSASSTFPTETFNNNNYWVDVVFDDSVTPTNTPPVAVDDGGFTTAFDTPLGIAAADLLANDSDPDGDPLSVTAVSDPLNGSVALDPQGDPLFTPEPGFSGAAGFTYTAADGNGGTAQALVSLDVEGPPANTPPVAVDDVATTDEDSVATLDVLANDSDGDGDPLGVAAVDTTGTLGSVAINPDNSVTYDPGAAFQALPAGASADDSFTYTADDGQGGTAVATVALTVTGVNDAPAAVDDGGFSTAFDTPLEHRRRGSAGQ